MNKAWVIDVNMGYGHQRTAYPLRDLAPERAIISANDYDGIPERDRNLWNKSRGFYEFISNFKKVPLIGGLAFYLFDLWQKIPKFNPQRDLSRPNMALGHIYRLINKGWGRDLIEKLKANPLPIVTTFFTPAFMAETFAYPGEIFCVICDTDISRSWAPINPQTSRIKYFAPTQRAAERLELYGVKKENIYLTGYPLPEENVNFAEEDLKKRLINLTPNHPLTLTFALGGVGAQREIGLRVLKSLEPKIAAGAIKVIIVAGVRADVKDYFKDTPAEILFEETIENYFKKFNEALKTTDILWTKPSELSFYTALGLPIIIAPPIGSQEDFNKEWLINLGSGIPQQNPDNTDKWLFDLINSGQLAKAAENGFLKGERNGTINIRNILDQCPGF